jgi:HD-like signal output (HDOD) protein
MERRLQDIVAATGELPALPSTTARLLKLLDDDTVGADEVLDIIGRDPALTANLLKLCNSAYYGLRRRVGTVHEALIMLGNRAVVSLAFATSLGDVLRGPLAGYHLERDELWKHALAVGVGAAHILGNAGDRGRRERAFTGGLVHDIGKLVLNGPLKAKLQQLPPAGDFVVLLEGERAILGFDHAQAGAALAESWNFPPALAAVIGAHHAPVGAGAAELPEGADAPLLCAVQAANLIASRAGLGAGTRHDEDQWRAGLAELGIDETEAIALQARLPGDVSALCVAFGGPR